MDHFLTSPDAFTSTVESYIFVYVVEPQYQESMNQANILIQWHRVWEGRGDVFFKREKSLSFRKHAWRIRSENLTMRKKRLAIFGNFFQLKFLHFC